MKNRTERVKSFMQYLTLFIGAAIMFLPFFWMINSSFKTEKELLSFQSFFPKQLLIDNFRQAWEMGDFPRYFGNSVFVTVVCVALTMFVTILAAYGFSKLKFPGRDLIFTVLVSVMMIPF
ncbi:MAG: carbohydrate ABC transporter permease [Erysipelotrichaceae bacterium]|nr:carbohydrate ABC transporter permease [Erysipelotrichaceae bacterium]